MRDVDVERFIMMIAFGLLLLGMVFSILPLGTDDPDGPTSDMYYERTDHNKPKLV